MAGYDLDILELLATNIYSWWSPTGVGAAFLDAFGRPSSSSWASPKLLRLANQGLLRRNAKGHYRLTIKGAATILSRVEDRRDAAEEEFEKADSIWRNVEELARQ